MTNFKAFAILFPLLALLADVSAVAVGQDVPSNDGTNAPLILSSQGSFAVGGSVLHRPGAYDNSRFPGWGKAVEAGQSYHADHAVVDYQLPLRTRKLPLVFLHGYGQSARCWRTTPDGREGFDNLFLRRRYGVYLVDLPGRGRAGRTTAETCVRPLADEQFWFDIFRIGEWPEFNPGVQFPADGASLDQFFRQMTPDIGSHDMEKELSALDSLFKRIGGGILATHSAGGFPGWMAAIRNPEVRGIVSLEPGTYVFPEGEVPEDMPSLTGTMKGVGISLEDFRKLTRIPIVLYFGDYIPEEPSGKLGGENWRVRLQMGRKFVEALNRHGGRAALVELPKIGIRGNTHFMMADKNNSVIAGLIADWLHRNGLDE